MVVHSNSLVQM